MAAVMTMIANQVSSAYGIASTGNKVFNPQIVSSGPKMTIRIINTIQKIIWNIVSSLLAVADYAGTVVEHTNYHSTYNPNNKQFHGLLLLFNYAYSIAKV